MVVVILVDKTIQIALNANSASASVSARFIQYEQRKKKNEKRLPYSLAMFWANFN